MSRTRTMPGNYRCHISLAGIANSAKFGQAKSEPLKTNVAGDLALGYSSDRTSRIPYARAALLAVMIAAIATGCGASEEEPETTEPPSTAIPESLDGFWLLEGSDLVLDIMLDTATVSGSNGCARVLGSLTADPSGKPTSFSLPGRDDSACSPAERDSTNAEVEVLETTQSVRARAGGFELLDAEGQQIGLLRAGG